MNDEKYEKLSDLTREITSMTYVLQYYCSYFDGQISEFSNVYEYVKILNEKAFELYELL